MNFASCKVLVCCLAWLGSFNLPAQDLAAWRVGNLADADISTPVALDVVDTKATAARKAEAALKTPAIFRNISSITNTMVLKLQAAFAEAHFNFLAGLEITYRQTNLDEATLQSMDFGSFLTAFNFRNTKFPITTDLARQWARGGTGLATQTNLIEQLLQAANRPVRPDDVVGGFPLGDTLRVVTVRDSKQMLTPGQAEQRGTLTALTNVITVTRLRGLFRRNYPPEDLLVARAMANYLHPNCELETNLTQQARELATSQIVVAYHYDAGQVIVRRGQMIDGQMQAALTRLSEILPAGQISQPVLPGPGEPVNDRRSPGLVNPWLAAALATVSTVFVLGIWRWLPRRRPPVSAPARLSDSVAQNELAPQLALAVKSAVVQELAAQRQDLLQTQQMAAAEVLQLIQRLNELQAPLQERLGVYESRIQELEKELGEQSKENRELLKLQIDLLREKIETEHRATRVNFN